MSQQESAMNDLRGAATAEESLFDRLREACARSLGVSLNRKEELYIEILKSASLRDVSYWLQVFFAAGIATLGLVLNSVAVIIGAMLISPLMGPILASGLALAAGDLILGIRALTSILLSCLLAIALAVLLVSILPFKEITAEIAARTQPNTLDFVVALFSGAVGSIAICKEVKGVVTSIPGVAIAVALMPPLCVTGFGLGIALSSNVVEGLRIAQGGGLLFLTNLVAITFTAMLVFLMLHIDTSHVKERVREWREHDLTSRKVRLVLKQLPGYERLKLIGSLPARVMLILLMVSLLLVPLSQSFGKLKQELSRKQRDNLVRQAATDVWQKEFSQMPDGTPRCFLGNITTQDRNGKLNLAMRVFTSKPYTASEENDYATRLASRLRLPRDLIALNLIEIPTATNELQARAVEAKPTENAPEKTASNITDTQAELTRLVANGLDGLPLPAPAQLIGYEMTTRPNAPLVLRVGYLSPREISADAQNILAADINSRLSDSQLQTSFEWFESERQPFAFNRNQFAVTDEMGATLEPVATTLRRYPDLRLEIVSGADRTEREGIIEARAEAVIAYLNDRWQIPGSRLSRTVNDKPERSLILKFTLLQGTSNSEK
ncbi:MAG: DUF389 domain-containing protein [Pyrinomonadaceae bacterium MAG19_C2-C3]|nr:DUF389 domain-containing protein [Pyrinomonadaceae bacterium MAG19_C2-C3]